jgi:P2-related tail formation protein
MGGTVKAWKQKASTWIKRALIIAGIVLVVAVGSFLAYKAVVGATKSRLRKQIATLQAQVSAAPAASGPSPTELLLLANVLNKK